MTETGIVESVEGLNATVAFKRTDACGKCGACMRGDADDMRVKLPNELNALPGQAVEVEMADARLLSASLVAYVIPLAALMAGIFSGMALGAAIKLDAHSELFTALCGILFLLASFLFVRWADKRAARKGMGLRMIRIR